MLSLWNTCGAVVAQPGVGGGAVCATNATNRAFGPDFAAQFCGAAYRPVAVVARLWRTCGATGGHRGRIPERVA
jgi:hypothetical protein